MDITDLIANIALILPGLLTEKIIATLSVRRERSELQGLMLAVVYSFIDVIVALGLQHLLAKLSAPTSMLHIEPPRLCMVPMEISLAPGIVLFSALLVAMISVLYINRDGHAFFRRLGITQRRTYADVWSEMFWRAGAAPLRLQLRDGRQVSGTLGRFDDFEEGHVEILQPRIRSGDGSLDAPGGSMLLERSGIADVVFLEDHTIIFE